MEFYVVDSVKGGCGKTATAIWKSLELASTKENKVCYIDMDILGTSLETYLQISIDAEAKYLSELFSKSNAVKCERCIKKQKFIKENYEVIKEKTVEVNYDKESLIEIGMIISSPNETDKKMFKPNIMTHYVYHIDYDFFARKLEILFDELEKGGYTHMVIDMPPNSDPYTDSVFDILLNRKNSSKDVNLIIVSLFDRSHVEANLKWIEDRVQSGDQNWHNFKKVELFFNDNRGAFDEYKNSMDGVKKQIDQMINKNSSSANNLYKLKDNSYYLHYNKELSIFSIIDAAKLQEAIGVTSSTTPPAELNRGINFNLNVEKYVFELT